MEDRLSLHPLWYEQIMKQQASFKRNTAPRSDWLDWGKYNRERLRTGENKALAHICWPRASDLKDNWPSIIITIIWSQFNWTEAHETCLWNSHTQYAHQKIRRHEDYAKAHFTKWAKKLNKDISGRLKLLWNFSLTSRQADIWWIILIDYSSNTSSYT